MRDNSIIWALWAFNFSVVTFIIPWIYMLVWLPLMYGIAVWIYLEKEKQRRKLDG